MQFHLLDHERKVIRQMREAMNRMKDDKPITLVVRICNGKVEVTSARVATNFKVEKKPL